MKDNSIQIPDKINKRRVLIVDDEKDFVLSLADILESYDYIVETAHNGKGAKDKIKEFQAEVALLDLRLGRENGINLIFELKETAPKLLPVVMTAYATTDNAIEALQEGAYDYLRKPLNPMDLLATLDRCFERLRLEREKDAAEEARRRLESQLQQAQKMESIGTLAGGISHDFNNSLQAILGYTQMLLMETEKMDYIHSRLLQIEKAALRASELTHQLLAFSRKVESQLRPVDLNHEVIQIERLFQRTILKMINIELNLGEGIKIISADPSQIEQMLMNLAINARDALGEEGRITIKTENATIDQAYCNNHFGVIPGDYVLLTFSDTGHGMDENTLERIFEPFFTTKEPGKGTGLGLPMVYGLIKKHKGHIECTSKPGEGTCFKLFFPSIIEAVKKISDQDEEKSIPGGKETILLIDDEALVRELGEHMLTKFGYNVLTAPGGENGLHIYRDKKDDISLVILDIIMPVMGGMRCLAEILKIKPDAKIIIASGYSAEGNRKNVMELGAKGFINKPFNVSEMLVAVREVLDA